jgi:hypothetical protein
MAFIILIVVCTVVVAFLLPKKEAESVWDWLWFGFFGAVIGVLLGVLFSLILMLFVSGLPADRVKVDTEQVYALQDGDSATGSFFFGSGYVNGEMRYTYMAKEDGGLRMKQLDADGILIKEGTEPRVEKYTQKYTNSSVRFWFGDYPSNSEYEYVIYAPAGTVKQQFNVDLK